MGTTTTGATTAGRRGFTIIELLVVLAVIGILATIAVSTAMAIKRRSTVRLAQGNAGRLKQALDAYQAQRNFLPAYNLYNPITMDDEEYQNFEIIEQLNGIMERAPLLVLVRSEVNSCGSFKDPWGRPYRVVMWPPPPDRARYFQVYSCGENATWEMGKFGRYWAGGEVYEVCDDLAPER